MGLCNIEEQVKSGLPDVSKQVASGIPDVSKQVDKNVMSQERLTKTRPFIEAQDVSTGDTRR